MRQFIEWAADELGITLGFEGEGVNEIAVVTDINGAKAPALSIGDVVMRIDSNYFRPTEVDSLVGNPAKAKSKLGWEPKITPREMCAEMVDWDLLEARRAAMVEAFEKQKK